MTRWLWMGALVGCSGEDEATYAPALSFLQPTNGATVPAGDLAVSIVVEDFELGSPEGLSFSLPPTLGSWLVATAEAHNEQGAPAGYCALTLDGVSALDLSSTQGTVSGLLAGPHVLTGELRYADGDPLEPPVEVEVSFTAE